jgi:hypothetical protein
VGRADCCGGYALSVIVSYSYKAPSLPLAAMAVVQEASSTARVMSSQTPSTTNATSAGPQVSIDANLGRLSTAGRRHSVRGDGRDSVPVYGRPNNLTMKDIYTSSPVTKVNKLPPCGKQMLCSSPQRNPPQGHSSTPIEDTGSPSSKSRKGRFTVNILLRNQHLAKM